MTSPSHPAAAPWRTPLIVVICGCLIALVGFGVRSSFGLWLEPMTLAKGWSRETFALAMAIQNLFWGLGLPFAGALADKFGAPRVLAVGALLYAAGVAGMAVSDSGLAFQMTGGVLTGLGVAFTAFSIALAAMAKVVAPSRRSLALGLGTAAGSAGQVVFSPFGQALIAGIGWHDALFVVAATTLLVIPLAFILPGASQDESDPLADMTIGGALREALSHRGYVLLTAGFFVCGFHIAFITVHFPAYVTGLGLDPAIGAYALALVGLCNIVGAFASGAFGQRWSKRSGLSAIYFVRAIAITALLLLPKTEVTILVFAGVMGLLWLSTVPLTTGIVAQVFGMRYMATLFGIVFLSHQIGSFLGVWLGGYLYDTMGTYDPVWWAGVVLGLMAAVIHLPIDERPIVRAARPAPAA
ncbi:MFS transporter [Marivibrio halodurans]|uniref:MFS transporter n=1 Tax=Marivibrio halodurans TaxID=2039722 RepID=A0A8J7S065_9PROT|nr:MFS transporter [Marivibrio halodurans]MBP5857942.1 MFS transporter [Marivibrio halodurans]